MQSLTQGPLPFECLLDQIIETVQILRILDASHNRLANDIPLRVDNVRRRISNDLPHEHADAPFVLKADIPIGSAVFVENLLCEIDALLRAVERVGIDSH